MSQSEWRLDTLKLNDFKSNSLPLFSTRDILFEILDTPELIEEEKTITICDSIVGYRKKLSQQTFNFFYYINKQIQYIEKDNKIRLVSVDFKLNNSVKIETLQICLNRNLKLKSMLKAFQLSLKTEGLITKRFPPPWNYGNGKIEKAYRVVFFTGESNCTTIEIYFDKKKKLRFIHIDPYYF
jgi:hypothetical protein